MKRLISIPMLYISPHLLSIISLTITNNHITIAIPKNPRISEFETSRRSAISAQPAICWPTQGQALPSPGSGLAVARQHVQSADRGSLTSS